MTIASRVENGPNPEMKEPECSNDCPIYKTLAHQKVGACFLNFEEGCGKDLGIDVTLLKAMCTHRDSRDNCLIEKRRCQVKQLEDFLPCLKIRYAYFPQQVIEVARSTCLAKGI